MKTFLTLLLATFLSTTAFAYGEGRLTITLANTRSIQVVIDGRTYQPNGNNTVVLDNLRPGNHTIRVYENRRGSSNNRRSDCDGDLVYSSTINVKSFQHVDIMINRFGKALVDERDLRTVNDRWDDYYDDGRDDRYNRPMNDQEFNRLVENIKSKWFSTQKIQAAKDAVQHEYFRTDQVRQLLVLFSTDNDKLELAKLAYDRTVDKRSFYTLYDVFSFQSSRDELDRYIKQRR